MRTIFILFIGILIGAAVASIYWQAEQRKVIALSEGLSRMWGDNLVLLGVQGADALALEAPEATRDFTNYMIDSALLRLKADAVGIGTNKPYESVLVEKISALPPDRRSLSSSAPRAYKIARETLDTPTEKLTP